MASKRVNVKAILADADLRRKLMVSTIQATQAREGIETSPAQADRAYYVVTEAERASFFELERFKGGKRGEQDKRHEMFVKSLRAEHLEIRHDVARRDLRRGTHDGIRAQRRARDRIWLAARRHRTRHGNSSRALERLPRGVGRRRGNRFGRLDAVHRDRRHLARRQCGRASPSR